MKLQLIHGQAKINGKYVNEAIIEVSEVQATEYLKSGAWKNVTSTLEKEIVNVDVKSVNSNKSTKEKVV